MTVHDAHAMHALAEKYVAATEACDLEALVELTAADAEIWHNHDGVEIDPVHANRTLAWLHRTVPDVAWQRVSVVATTEGFVWRSILTGTAPGGPLRVHSCVVATVSDVGKIVRVDEYLDPAGLAVLTG